MNHEYARSNTNSFLFVLISVERLGSSLLFILAISVRPCLNLSLISRPVAF